MALLLPHGTLNTVPRRLVDDRLVLALVDLHLLGGAGALVAAARVRDLADVDRVREDAVQVSDLAGRIEGVATSLLTIRGPTIQDNGAYHLQVTSDCGSAASPLRRIAVACAADLSSDGTVDVFDLLIFLDLWFGFDAGADLDDDLFITVFDLLEYLDSWFAGC
jgi:hypothetical protein